LGTAAVAAGLAAGAALPFASCLLTSDFYCLAASMCLLAAAIIGLPSALCTCPLRAAYSQLHSPAFLLPSAAWTPQCAFSKLQALICLLPSAFDLISRGYTDCSAF
jgi:hypothetical protein